MHGNNTPPSKLSRVASSRRKLMALASKAKPGLALDTTVTRHTGQMPQQVYPYESKTDEERAGVAKTRTAALKQHHESHLPLRSQNNAAASSNGNPVPAMHNHVKGLRPTPLDLAADAYSSNGAISIGLAVPSGHNKNTSNDPPLRSQESALSTGAFTPTIVVTPAKEDFDLPQSPMYDHVSKYRPASSIYSRHTNCMLKGRRYSKTPPVPPLPLFADPDYLHSLQDSRASSTSIVEENTNKHQSKNVALSICTAFDDDSSIPKSAPPRDSRRITRQSHLPTPLRNKGWWNLITSPFSANSAAFFWRSPTIGEKDEDTRPMMSETAAMGLSNPLFGRIFNGRKDGDDELRSAPADHADSLTISKGVHDGLGMPKRSFTAPDALSFNESDVNIYRIPSYGEAAAYYDRSRHFPSLLIYDGDQTASREAFDGVMSTNGGANDDEVRALSAAIEDASSRVDRDHKLEARLRDMESRLAMMEQYKHDSSSDRAVSEDTGDDPFADFDQNTARPLSDASANARVSRAIFTSPSADELATPPTHNQLPTQANAASQSAFSPLSPSPIVANAHVAQVVGPGSARGEQFEIAIPPTRDSPSASGVGLGAATMASRSVSNLKNETQEEPYQWQPAHTRQQSRGLGISDADSERYPPPQPLSEKVTLGTDRYRQLTVRSLDDPEEPIRPWYREFFWLLVSSIAFLLILMVVLLVVFVPQKHDDTPVQAQWLNLTGFPALPTGIATVVQPRNVQSESRCVQQSSLWSCAAQNDDQTQAGSSLPNFRFEIRFRNGTTSNDTALVPSKSVKSRRSGNGAEAGTVVRSAVLMARDSWASYLYAASPSPPSVSDQSFLGNTTDNITLPYDGEETPFFISLLDASAIAASASSKLRRRNSEDDDFQFPYPSTASGTASTPASTISSLDTASTASEAATTSTLGSASSSETSASATETTTSTSISTSSTSSEHLASVATEAPASIPKPAKRPNGKPAAADLYPFAYAQPLRLYNRGTANEHYGFYTYFDRSLYVSSLDANSTSGNGTTTSTGTGTTSSTDAAAVCTWSQTRFRVQIWTRRGTLTSLGGGGGGSVEVAASNSSANAMGAPGSFPYPVTVALDRHGGDAGEKGVYCYGLDGEGQIVDDVKMWVDEDRGFGGSLVNAAQVPGGSSGDGAAVVTKRGNDRSGVLGGIDGGTGGCGCQWSSLNM